MNGESPMRRRVWGLLRRLLALIAVVSIALLLCEGWFRFRSYKKIADEDLPIRSVMSQRLLDIWTPTITNTAIGGLFLKDKDNVLMPPFSTFSNRGEDDRERLAHVFPYAILPRSRTFTATDFLVNPKRLSQSTYHATSNAFGFRDPERSREKPPGTYRIICLGSYTTFGHAVQDTATYEQELERRLNAHYGPGRRFEVWNGGIHAATAIMGLARIENDVLSYAPDLVLLDYGFVDLSFYGHDYLAPGDHALRGVPFYGGFLRGRRNEFWSGVLLPHVMAGPFGYSYLGIKILDRLGQASQAGSDTPEAAFVRVMRTIVDRLRAHGVAAAFLNPVSYPAFETFARLAPQVGAPYFNVYELIDSPTNSEFAAFDAADDTWVTEFGSLRDRLSPEPQYARLRPYLADIYQLNALGHRRLAEGLERALVKTFLELHGAAP